MMRKNRRTAMENKQVCPATPSDELKRKFFVWRCKFSIRFWLSTISFPNVSKTRKWSSISWWIFWDKFFNETIVLWIVSKCSSWFRSCRSSFIGIWRLKTSSFSRFWRRKTSRSSAEGILTNETIDDDFVVISSEFDVDKSRWISSKSSIVHEIWWRRFGSTNDDVSRRWKDCSISRWR